MTGPVPFRQGTACFGLGNIIFGTEVEIVFIPTGGAGQMKMGAAEGICHAAGGDDKA